MTVFAANHLALIRSFLIDSGIVTPLREASCANFFCCVHKRAAVARVRKTNAKFRKFYTRARAVRKLCARKKSLFHRNFCNFEIARVMLRAASK